MRWNHARVPIMALPLALLLCLAVIPADTAATVSSAVTFDGVWWQSMSRAEKLIAVQGMLVGYDAGYRRAAGRASDATEGTSGTKFYHTLMDQETDGSDLTFVQIVNRIDQVFINHPSIKTRGASLFVDCSIIKDWDCEVAVKDLSN